ncbi:hypothetical protein EJ06DRAFT_530847 [Trichodelitschia bisporula]|uniref:Methyltransferase domain-containing protein n=1 Tax=Trichodelitschia bisporula TaxID=703511 RepID=A0A6G1HVQ8_9PEZI|nr:hypothetical protein EJ06DRAFT_530847 [Trichodelitschia bisporula]
MLQMSDWMVYRNRGGPDTRYSSRSQSIDETRPPVHQWTHLRSSRSRPKSTDSSHHVSSLSASMDIARGNAASVSNSSTSSVNNTDKDDAVNPLVLRHGRRYLRDLSYPLPCDLPELHRQNLHTLLATEVFGKALCSPFVKKRPPKNVLEIGCGTGFWSSLCHDYLTDLGVLNVSFTGLDIVRLAPDLEKQGINWKFVQHDIRRLPLPFDDEEFDLVLLKDLSLVVHSGAATERLLDDAIRVLRHDGVVEIWETDHIIRSLQPYPPTAASLIKRPEEQARALETGTFIVSPATPFSKAQNKYLGDFNTWIQEACDRRKLSPVPCANVQPMLIQETDSLCDIGFRRVAIPFGEMKWERHDPKRRRAAAAEKGKGKSLAEPDDSVLSEEQASLRTTALLVVVQLIESLEPVLKEVSSKNQEEWQRWWAWMMADLFEQGGAEMGDCLELGAYWARKI